MGTSSVFGGQSGNSPLIPSFVGDAGAPSSDDAADAADGTEDDAAPASDPPQAPQRPPIPSDADPARFATARSNLTRWVRSGGSDRKSLGRAVSNYVGSSTGGARGAARRMGSSRGAGARLLGFLADAATRGVVEALRALDLAGLAGRPIEEIFLGLADYVCPDGGSVDEGIARQAFIETIVDLADAGITDLDTLTEDQMQTVFELYASNAIEARLLNDIGNKAVILPASAREAASIQAQLADFIRRGVADALTAARTAAAALTPDRVLGFVGRVYEQAFDILRIMGDGEAAA